jgi:hypothetical protein
MPSFGQVQLPTINPLFDLASVDKNVNAINAGQLANQLASNTLASNTQIAANTAQGGDLANQLATQKNPLEIIGMRQQLGIDPSPTLDKLQNIYGGGQQSSDASLPRGIRNNNPINLEFAGQDGATKESGPNGRFAVFPTMAAGQDAALNQFKMDAGQGNDTVRGLITKYAPPSENDTNGYVAYMAKALGVGPDDHLDFNNPDVAYAFLGGMSSMENGKQPAVHALASHIMAAPPDQRAALYVKLRPAALAAGAINTPAQYPGDDVMTHIAGGGWGSPPQSVPGAPAQPGVALAPNGAAPPAAGPQMATRGPIPGQPATDAGPMPVPPVPPATGVPQVQNPNVLLPLAAVDGSAAPSPQNALAPRASAPPAAQPGTGMNSPQVQQAQALMQRAAQIEMAAAATPNDPRAKATAAAMAADLKARAAVLMQADSVMVGPGGVQTHTLTGKQDNAAVPAMNYQPDPNNPGVLSSPGQKPVVLPPGRPFQVEGQGAFVAGPGGVTKQVVAPDLPAIAGQKAAETQGSGTGTQAVTQAGDLIKMGRAADTAIGNIDYGLNQLGQANKAGLPTGYYSPGVASAAAALKYFGLHLPGVKPEAVADLQTAQKTLAVVGGAILQNTIGKDSQITDGKISAFIHTQPGIELDPEAIPRILNWARSQFVYEREMSMTGMQAASENKGMLPLGWQAGYFAKKGSFAPIYDPLSGEMKQPEGQGPTREPPAAPSSSQGAPARISDDAGYTALPSGATFVGPDGHTRRKP